MQTMVSGDHILIDEISLADDSVLERLNSVLEPERTLVIPDKASMVNKRCCFKCASLNSFAALYSTLFNKLLLSFSYSVSF